MDPKQREQQVKQFFSHHPIDDDQLYLKKFVREHPDQKMAWYLLGREYAAQGKDGKAAYCFAQAGEVYEAFEKQKLNVDLDGLKRQAEAAASAPAAAQAVRGTRRRRTALLGACLAALLALSASAVRDAEPGTGAAGAAGGAPAAAAADARGAKAPAKAAGAAGEAATGGAPSGAAGPSAGAPGAPAVVYTAPGEAGAGDAAAQQLLALLAGSGGEAIAAAGTASPDGRWVYWQVPAAPFAWLAASGPGGERIVRPLDPQACACQAGDAAKARIIVNGWAAAQEEQAVLRSAIAAFRGKYGADPAQPEQLARPYPDNLLPGLTPSMKEQFPAVLQQLRAGAGPIAGTVQAATEPNSQAAKAAQTGAVSAKPLAEPLRIVVDKDLHRLALVSGNRIVRLYAVGLGGDRTPEGEFAITEKVRNPNNKSNGDFGSRGMTLSDTQYAIHGTNKPASIGKDDSLGCVRMGQEDIEELYDMVPHGTKVTIGKGLLPPGAPLSGQGGDGEPGNGKGKPRFRLPLQTDDGNPKKTYKWLD